MQALVLLVNCGKHGIVFNAYGICMIRNVIFRSYCSFGDDKDDFSYPYFTFSCGYDIRLRVCGLHVKCGFVMVLSTWAVYSWTLSCKLSHDSISSSGSQVGSQVTSMSFVSESFLLLISEWGGGQRRQGRPILHQLVMCLSKQ